MSQWTTHVKRYVLLLSSLMHTHTQQEYYLESYCIFLQPQTAWQSWTSSFRVPFLPLFPLSLSPVSSFAHVFIRGSTVMILTCNGKPTLGYSYSITYQRSCDVHGIPADILWWNAVIHLFGELSFLQPASSTSTSVRDFLLYWMFPRITSNSPKRRVFSELHTICVGGKSEQWIQWNTWYLKNCLEGE